MWYAIMIPCGNTENVPEVKLEDASSEAYKPSMVNLGYSYIWADVLFILNGLVINVPIRKQRCFKFLYPLDESYCMHHAHIPLHLNKDLENVWFILHYVNLLVQKDFLKLFSEYYCLVFLLFFLLTQFLLTLPSCCTVVSFHPFVSLTSM